MKPFLWWDNYGGNYLHCLHEEKEKWRQVNSSSFEAYLHIPFPPGKHAQKWQKKFIVCQIFKKLSFFPVTIGGGAEAKMTGGHTFNSFWWNPSLKITWQNNKLNKLTIKPPFYSILPYFSNVQQTLYGQSFLYPCTCGWGTVKQILQLLIYCL